MAIPEKPFVLLVDDNEPTCTLITALLRKDFAVDVANDGLEAIDKLRTKTFHAIILDLLMPQLDGYGVLDHLRANSPEMIRRVLVVTAALIFLATAPVLARPLDRITGTPPTLSFPRCRPSPRPGAWH